MVNIQAQQHKFFVEERERVAERYRLEVEDRYIVPLDDERSLLQLNMNPDLLCVYKVEADVDLVYCVERYDAEIPCESESCLTNGCYYMTNEKYKLGMCRKHIEEYVKEDRCQFSRVYELPAGHDYGTALAIDDVE